MNKHYGYHYFLNKRKPSIIKKISIINGLLLVLQMSFGSLFFIALPAVSEAVTNQNLCPVAADIVLVMDRSGSMGYSDKCEWWHFNNGTFQWELITEYDYGQNYCNGKNQAAPHNSVWTQYNPKKIVAAKQAANTFLNLMGVADQSALISYADNATLDKGLSNNHLATESAVNGLVTGGATNIGDAIKLGTTELKSTRSNSQAVKAMILLTDGLANKPNGNGNDESPLDVAYALSKATEAAGYDYKIFTIGLGSNNDIDETMLQSIANITSAQYYHSPTQNDLQAIYNSIASKICEYSSIAGCKWNDVNDDGSWQPTETQLLAGWEIVLNGPVALKQNTDANGCYQFSGLVPGSYTLTETQKPGWVQTYPAGGSHTANITDWNQHLQAYHFGNYQPICGNQIVDSQFGEVCEVGQTQACQVQGYQGSQSCLSNCSGWGNCVPTESCGDGVINNGEQCDGQAGVPAHYRCTAQCTLEYIPYCGDNLVNQPWEQCDSTGGRSCTTVAGYHGSQNCNQCLWGDCQSAEHCGDGIRNGAEICDDGTSNGQPNHCNADCSGQTAPVCGNGIKETNEQCDSGSHNGQYGYCNSDCSGLTLAVCGNGVKEGAEQCDGQDGIPAHYQCNAGCTLVYLPYCGDNQVNQPSEQCDGNTKACNQQGYDGIQVCNGNCQWGDCILQQWCGDGMVNDSEQCDYANTFNIPEHYLCTYNCLLQYVPYCGDNLVNQPSEQCDGSQTQNCQTANGYAGQQLCSQCNWGQCQTSKFCGDGLINGNEVCDDGGSNGQPNHCNGSCSGQTPAVCGNGVKEGSEQCDGQAGIQPHYICTQDCQLQYQPYCGDHTTNGSEVCDGNSIACQAQGYNGSQLCNANCDDWGQCQTSQYCGDGTVNNTEECDGDAPRSCTTLAGYAGTQSCSGCIWAECQTSQSCGDGVKNGNEQCDGQDGIGAHQSCNAQCTLVNLPYCGDGGCNNGESCSTCAPDCGSCGGGGGAVCGNGVKEGSEQCDGTDGVGANQSCSAQCTINNLPHCGDGSCQTNESCLSCSQDCGGCGGGSDISFGGSDTPTGGAVILPGYTAGQTTTTTMPIVLGLSGAPLLVINKTINQAVANPGDKNIKFTIIVTNNGNLTAYNAILADYLPTGFSYANDGEITTYQAALSGIKLTNSEIEGQPTKIWSLGDIKPGKIVKIEYLADIDGSQTRGKYSSPATVKADNYETVMASADLEIKPVKVLAQALAPTGIDVKEILFFLGLIMLLLIMASQIVSRFIWPLNNKIKFLRKILIFDKHSYFYRNALRYFRN